MSLLPAVRSLVRVPLLTRTFQNGFKSIQASSIHHCARKGLSTSLTSTVVKSGLLSKVHQPALASSLTVQAKRFLPTLNQVRRHNPRTKRKRSKPIIPASRRILLGPQRKGVCVKNVVRTPRKPNSAQRKCAVLRLNDGRLITAYIPGEKANLQEHGVVLFRGGRVQDCPGLKYKIIRGVYDMN
ncbi:small ribosomal subunit protein uS12-like [Clytia hemisphaerica]|uniref:small ribosomal subunit protein uS12-like n=1 Tax=Clytia hemisphaerica TaxID=252671 RepID=UPI0034D6688B